MAVSAVTWNLLTVARGDASYASPVESLVAPVALLIALRWADEYDKEQATIAAFNGVETRPILTPSLRWSVWREALRPLSSGEVAGLWDGIRLALDLPGDPRGMHQDVRLPSGRLLSAMVGWIESFPLDTPATRRQAGEAFTELVLQTMDLTRFGGEIYTPRPIARLMVALCDPRPGERIYDPCFGAGSLLVEVAETLWTRGRDVAPGQWASAERVPLFGVERQTSLHLVAFVRLLLTGLRPALEIGDALEREAAGRHHDQGFDCVLVDPPLGGKVELNGLYHFPIGSRGTDNLFVQHALRSLRPGGRAVIAVALGVLFRGGADRELRRWLLTEYCVDAVIRLPDRARMPSTGVKTALLVVRRAAPAETVRFVEMSGMPEQVETARAFAKALSGTGDVAPHVLSVVPVAELLKGDARLDDPTAFQVEGDESLGALAKLTEFRPLREVAGITNGTRIPKDALVEEPGPQTLPVFRTGDLGEGALRVGRRFLHFNAKHLAEDDLLVRQGDVLVSTAGSIGKVLHIHRQLATHQLALFHEQVKNIPHGSPANQMGLFAKEVGRAEVIGLAERGLAIVRVHDGVDARFLEAVLSSRTYQAILRRHALGTNVAHLPLKALRELQIPVPPIAIQEKLLRRLADRPTDAIDALMGVLAGQDEDPVVRLFGENLAISRLVAEGVPESDELYQLGLDAFGALRQLRNQLAHAPVDVGPHALRWVLMVGAVPVVAAGRRRTEALDFELIEATRAMLEHALEGAREVGGLLGRQATRLTERLLAWVDGATTRAARDFKLEIVHEFGPPADHELPLEITARLVGSVPLRNFVARVDVADGSIQVAELVPGQSALLRVVLKDDMAWEQQTDALLLACRLVWSARRVDGQSVDGAEPLVLRRLATTERDVEAQDLGTSPYITGDVVDDPDMFFGRRAILEDIGTHLGGGTKVILLEGNRRTGKTSILRQLQHPKMGLLDSWILVECSFQGTVGDAAKDGISTEGVFQLLVRDIGLACARAGKLVPLPDMGSTGDINSFRFKLARALKGFFRGIDPYEALQIYVDTVTAAIAPKRLLLMLDEFDKLQVGIDNGVTSPQVPENIRNLLQTRPTVSAILTGSRRLKRLREEYWSALFGFGHRIGLDPLDVSEVSDLVTRPVAGRLAFDDAAILLVADLTGRQPYLVQSLCARIFELAKRSGWSLIRREEVLEAVSRMVRDNEHFQALWSYAETERRRYLMCLCHRLADGAQRVNAALLNEHLDAAGIGVPTESVDDDLKFLVELELVTMVNTALGPQYELAVPLMRRWMDLNIDAEAQRRRAVHEQQVGVGRGYGDGDGRGRGDGSRYGDGSADGSGRGDGSRYGCSEADVSGRGDGTPASGAAPSPAPKRERNPKR